MILISRLKLSTITMLSA